MIVLSVHNSYQIRGGEDKSTSSERELLKEFGIEVITFDKTNHDITGIRKFYQMFLFLFNFKVFFEIRQIIKKRNVDVVHVQNFFPLISPSVFFAAKSLGVPTLMTIRNYRLFCSNGLFYRDNNVCTKCINNRFNFYALLYACYRDSRLQSMYMAFLFWFYSVIGAWKKVDKFVLLTEFQKKLFLENGFSPSKLVVKGNFVSDQICPADGKKKQVLFVGRISEEKGIKDLIKLWSEVGVNTDLNLVIAGEGPLYDWLKEASQKLPNVKVLGQVEYDTVYKLMAESTALIFTSNWFEGMPRTIIESYACGTPVISNNLGAMSSMIIDGKTGFKYNSLSQLRDLLQQVIDDQDQFIQMKEACIEEYKQKYEKKKNALDLITIYSDLLNRRMS